MVKTVTIDELLRIAALVGVRLRRTDEARSNLYVWATKAGHVLYVGRSETVRRLLDEERWRKQDHRRNLMSGIVALLAENDAVATRLQWDPATFSPDLARQAVEAEQWQGASFDALSTALDADIELNAGDIEQYLVRLTVRLGVPIGNSQYASQWEGPIGSIADTLAVLAVDRYRLSGALPSGAPLRGGSEVRDV